MNRSVGIKDLSNYKLLISIVMLDCYIEKPVIKSVLLFLTHLVEEISTPKT